MRTRILTNWNWIRVVRLLIGFAAIAQGILQQQWALGAAGIFVGAMALANQGCCGSTGCAVTPTRTKNKKDIYEEVGG